MALNRVRVTATVGAMRRVNRVQGACMADSLITDACIAVEE